MKKILLSAVCIFSLFVGFAQTTNLGGPYGWKDKANLPKNVDTHVMPGYNQATIDAEDEINDQTKSAPWRFGYKYTTNLSLDNSGTWTTLPNGNRIWQIELVCDEAMTVNLIFENLFIPEGAYIYLYDIAQTNRVGAYTSRNNNAEKILGTELVHGDHIVVEYFEPLAVSGQGTLTIANVVHGYRSLNIIQEDLIKAFESSGNCNVDVNCTLGDGWENEIRSVAMIVVSGSGICTGALINNTCDDGTPYFLTADHCVGGGSTASWAFRFNWESPPGTEVCQTTGTSVNPGPPYDQTANGATQLFTSGASDVALLQITNMTLTDAQNWQCFYAGWDNTDATTVTQATGIHHPSGDLKKICRENNAPTHTTWGGAACWQIANWDNGVTEPGSSGSPLFDQNHRIIGQLYGGSAACSGTNDNNQPDYYGRFGVSWPNLTTWLAPGSCGSATVNDGFDPVSPPANDDAGIQNVIEPVGNYCTADLNPIVTLRNYGANTLTSCTINYNIDGGANNTFSWSGSLAPSATIDVALPTLVTTSGAHTFNVYTSNPNATADLNTGNDDASSSYTATPGGEEVTLTFDTDCWGYESAWQIVDGSMNVVAEGGNLSVIPGGNQNAGSGDPGSYANETTISESFCLTVGCYDLVVYDDWGDGLDGTSSGCGVDGNYELTDASMNVLASLITADFGDSETQNFCLTSGCTGTFNTVSVDANCNGLCDGSITVSDVGGVGPFSYDIGGGSQASNIFSGLCAGVFTIAILDGNGCTSYVNATVVEPTLIVGNTVSTDEVTGNDGTINLTATGGTGTLTYAWTGPGGFTASTEDISGLASGSYSVTITDANGCELVLTNIMVDSQLDIIENEQINVNVYPNPTTGNFTIDLSAFSNQTVEIIIRDVTGRVVVTYQSFGEVLLPLSFENNANGTYYISIRSDAFTIVKSIVIAK